ncbi:uncharacterized protein C8R40DRAFT_1131964 [Lentinula edodes]|uniref:uncharacterized protein n=1 Tax=Lentinula edodes TaxID=5353 RepID=UPI001E8EDAEC|nr:uncharacterized protein C8R40DRAFT_1131964 [Lentinula edodes]KAH7869089.1 hypothetical protein C8R40DRAFT_1131964 [Lentinula edodes]
MNRRIPYWARVFTRRDLTPEEPLGRLLSADLQRIHSVDQAIRYLRVSPPSESSNVLSLTSKNTCSALSFLVNEMHAPSSAIKSQAVQVIRDNWSDIFRWIEHLAAKFVFNNRFTDYDRRDLLALALPIILHVPLGGDDRRQFLEQTNEAPTLFSLLCSLWFHDMNHSKVTYSPSQQAMLVFSGILKQSPEALEFRVFQALADNRDVLSATCVSFFSKETWNLRSRVATDSVNLPICAQYIFARDYHISNSSKLVTLPGLTPRIVKDSLLQSCNNCLGLLIWNGYLEGQRWVVSMLRGGILLSLLQMPKLFPDAKAGTITETQDYSRVLIIKILTLYLVYPQVLHCFQRSLRSIDGREIPAYLQDEDTWGRLLQQNSQLSAQWKIYKVVEPPVCCYSICPRKSNNFNYSSDEVANKQLLCSCCKFNAYCSRQCQKGDWEVHRTQCNYLQLQFREGHAWRPSKIDISFIKTLLRLEMESFCRQFAEQWIAKGRQIEELPLSKQEDPMMRRFIIVDHRTYPAVASVEFLGDIDLEKISLPVHSPDTQIPNPNLVDNWATRSKDTPASMVLFLCFLPVCRSDPLYLYLVTALDGLTEDFIQSKILAVD